MHVLIAHYVLTVFHSALYVLHSYAVACDSSQCHWSCMFFGGGGGGGKGGGGGGGGFHRWI